MPRRLLAVAISGALALTGLAACRDLPTVAAYVGSAQLTNAEVESMVKEFPQEVRVQAEADAALASIAKVGTPQPPTDADKREIFASLVDQDVVRADEYEAVKNQIDSPQLRAALGLRPVMKDALHRYGVSVNPRYQPLSLPVQFSIGQVTTQVAVSLEPPTAMTVRG